MPLPNELWSPIYLPIKDGWSTTNINVWTGIDSKNLVHDLRLLESEITDIEVFLGVNLGGAITVDAVTTAVLAANTYSNGSSGVGATITITANGAFPTIDSQTAAVGKIYLIKNEIGANRYKNGIYILTTLGSSSTQAVLTRTTSSDTSTEFDNQVVFATYTKTGTTNGGKYFVQTTTLPTVGTSNIIYITRSGGGTQNLSQTLTIGDDATTQNIQNVGQLSIGKSTATVELDVIGNANISNATYSSGLFRITNTPTGSYGQANLGDFNADVNGSAIEIRDDTQRINIGLNIPAAIPTGTGGLYMGEATGFGYAGFTADYSNDNKNYGTYTIGRGSGLGSLISIQDADDLSGGIFSRIQTSGTWLLNVGVTNYIGVSPLDVASFNFNITKIPDFANNAAAVGGGLTIGKLYRTSTAGTSTLKIVE